MKVRIKFSKSGAMQYIGHLDILRFFQKAIRRAHIDISYSQGYSPHQMLSFASPLGIGMTSSGEYLDAFLNSSEGRDDFLNRLNGVMSEGMHIEDVKQITDETKHSNVMSCVAAADYELSFNESFSCVDWEECIKKFQDAKSCIVIKETKKNEMEMDIKPYVYKLNMIGDKLYMLVATGSLNNVKPELLVKALTGIECDRINTAIHRIDMYGFDDKGKLRSLNDFGVRF